MTDLPNHLVYGYHGTSTSLVPDILSGGFQMSGFRGDWLGNAIYFWENDYDRAVHWAETKVVPKAGGAPAVVAAVIDLRDCLDLTQMRYRALFRDVAEDFRGSADPEALEAMKQAAGNHQVDCEVANIILRATGQYGPLFRSVRGCFTEGDPLYVLDEARASGIHELDHIQIGVVHRSAITQLQVVEASLGY